MSRLFASLLVACSLALGASAQDARFEGRVTTADGGAPLVGATIILDGTTYGAATDIDGAYAFSAPAGAYTLVATYVGYEAVRREVQAAAGGTVSERFVLTEAATEAGEIVVTGVSRRAEKLTESPATVQVISGAELEALPGTSYEQALSRLKGVDFVRSGVTGVGINARGFNSAFNTKMLLLTDGRRQMLPGAGLPFAAMNPVIKEDVERVEVILGPSSALYGANAHNGIVNVITKDPRNSQGLTLVTSGGIGGEDSNVGSIRGRYAQAFLANRVALKATGEYTRAKDFNFADSVYVDVAASETTPAFTLRYPEQPDFDVEHLRGTAELFVSPMADTDLIVSYAGSQNSYLGPTNLGRNQVQDWTLHQLQFRAVHPRLFAQVYQTWSNSGDTYAIQNYVPLIAAGVDPDAAFETARFVDKSRRTNAEVQGNAEFAGFRAVAGVNYELETAISEGSYLSDTTGVDGLDFEQYGVSAQLERNVTDQLRVVAAGRYDWQTNYGERFSPKVGLVFTPVPGNSFRVTYGEAYVAPTVLQQELFLNLGAVVARGNANGFTLLNADGSTTEIPGVSPEEVGTFEVGYRGLPMPKLFADVNAYYSTSENFITPLQPLGVVTAIGGSALETPEYVFTYRNFGEVASYGADFALSYALTDRITVGGSYSYFDSDIDEESFDLNGDGVATPNEVSLNTAAHKGSLTLTARDFLREGLTGSLTVRGVSEYDFVSGRHFASDEQQGVRPAGYNYNYGPLGGFVTTDLSLGYRFSPMFSVGASVTNLFDVEQREFVAAAPTPRFVSLSLRADLPAFGN